MSYLSYFGSHWMLVIIVVLAVIAFVGLAWFTKNLKWVLAAVVLTIAGLAYQASNMDGYKRRVNEEAQVQVKLLQGRLDTLQHLTADDALRATANAYLNTKLDTLSRETPKNDGSCFDADAARRVRAIGSVQPVATPVSPLRHSIVFPGRHRRP